MDKMVFDYYIRKIRRLLDRAEKSNLSQDKLALLSSARQTVKALKAAYNGSPQIVTDGGPGSGNFGHKGVPGQVGGSAPSGKVIADSLNDECTKADDESYGAGKKRITKAVKIALSDMSYGSKLRIKSDKGADWSVEKVGGSLAIVKHSGSDTGELYPESQIEEDYAESYLDTDSLITNEVDDPNDRTSGLEKMTPKEFDEYIRQTEAKTSRERPQEEWGTGCEILMRELGLTKPPTTLNKQDFDDYVKGTGATVMTRGVSDSFDDDSGELSQGVDQVLYNFAHGKELGETGLGGGNFGSGHHFWSSPEELNKAKGFASASQSLDGDGAVITCAIKPTAKFMKMSEAEKCNDHTAYAIAHGYDGVVSDDGRITCVVNREILVMKEPEPSDFLSGDEGYQKYVHYMKAKKSEK